MVCPALEEDEGESGTEMKYENNAAYITEIGNYYAACCKNYDSHGIDRFRFQI